MATYWEPGHPNNIFFFALIISYILVDVWFEID